jgi:signal transduction histidine kinase
MLDLTHLRVLLIEANELDARVMLRAFREAAETRFDVERKVSLDDAIDALKGASYDCILVDLALPDTLGLRVLDAISEEAPATPVVVLTGLEDPRLAVEAVDRGAHDVLPKSRVDGDMVSRSIRYAVTRHHSETDLRAATEQLRIATDRNRIAQDLHDTVIQQLFAAGMGLQAVAGQIPNEGVRGSILESVDQIDTAIKQLRQTIFDLHVAPEPVAGDRITELIDRKTDALGFAPTVTRKGLQAIDPDLLHQIEAVVEEALSNVVQHANASAVSVTIVADDGQVLVEVVDDGVGPDSSHSTPTPRRGRGTTNLKRRASDLGGSCSIASGADGGTVVRWVVPID